MPLYEITTKGEDKKRLVEADSSSQAIRHCAAGMFTARTLEKPTDAARLMAGGVELETAGQKAAEPEPEIIAEK